MVTGGCHDSPSIFLALPPGPRGDHDCGHSGDGGSVGLPNSADASVGGGMPGAGWMRRWRGGSGAGDQASAPVHAVPALDCQATREERTASNEIVRKIIQKSGEYLIVIDRKGKILETSRAAARFLFKPWGRTDGTLLEELFSTVARTGQFLPVVAGMLDRRVRMAQRATGMILVPKRRIIGRFRRNSSPRSE